MFEAMVFYGDNLMKARKIRGMSMPAVVERSNDNISQAYISDLENKNSNAPTIDKINILAEALDFPWYYFFFEDGRLPANSLPSSMPEDVLRFLMDDENIKWIQLGMTAKNSSLSYQTIYNMLVETGLPLKRRLNPKQQQAT